MLAENDDLTAVVAYLSGLSSVEDAREDIINVPYFVPDDPLVGSMWALEKISAPCAWNISRGADILIAVCDTGVDSKHPDISINLWNDGNGNFGYDFSDNDTDASDYSGHGTHVAGTIAAVGDNKIGVVGIAFNAKIMSLKIFPNAYNSVAAKAILWAAKHGARLINCSWGPGTMKPVPPDPILKAAIDTAWASGCYCIFAAGNNNIDLNLNPQFPASYDKVITVAASNKADGLSTYSNYGAAIDIAAPGDNILSLKMGSNQYVGMSGTSMAAPHVTGAAALILSLAEDLSFENLRYFLKRSADPISTPQNSIVGRLNCCRLLTPGTQTYKRQANVDSGYARFALQSNGQIARIIWTGTAWVQSAIAVWGPPIAPGSLINMGSGSDQVAGVNKAGHVVITWNTPSQYAILRMTFGVILGTLRYSKPRAAFFGVNVFNDIVYVKWVGSAWSMDIIPCWGGTLVSSSVELCDHETQLSAINTFGSLAHTWVDQNGVTLSDGTKIGFSVVTATNMLIP